MSLRATLAIAATATLLVSNASMALTCYVVLDRSDNVIYRDVYPPVDLSDAGAPEREAMRRRGEYLLFMESDLCPRLEFFTGVAGSVTLRLEDTLAPTASPAQAEPKRAAPAAPPAPRRAAKPRAN